jgi:superfamily I DNA and/or RNA helicase
MSNVYGNKDGCRFLDVSESMLNVAVSRARDNFLVFGDIESYSNNKRSASGLLKTFIEHSKI